MEKAKLTKIYLVGSLGTRFGKFWELDVKSPAEAIRAININTKDKLFQYLGGPAKNKLYKVSVGKRDNVLDKEEIVNRSGRNAIYIIPTIMGASSGLGKILAGIALIGLTIITGGAAAIAAGGFWGTVATGVIGAGISMIIGGVVQLLTSVPNPNANNDEATRGSTIFQGNSTAVSQGGAATIVYGRALVSPMPISVTINNSDTSTTDAGSVGSVEVTELEGGGYQYETISDYDIT